MEHPVSVCNPWAKANKPRLFHCLSLLTTGWPALVSLEALVAAAKCAGVAPQSLVSTCIHSLHALGVQVIRAVV